jgi:hypothetical protein
LYPYIYIYMIIIYICMYVYIYTYSYSIPVQIYNFPWNPEENPPPWPRSTLVALCASAAPLPAAADDLPPPQMQPFGAPQMQQPGAPAPRRWVGGLGRGWGLEILEMDEISMEFLWDAWDFCGISMEFRFRDGIEIWFSMGFEVNLYGN